MSLQNHYKNVLLVGTSHIAQQSIQKITDTFNTHQPDIVCVELDRDRLHALVTNQKPNYSLAGIGKYGLQGYLFAVIGGWIQKKLGNVVGIQPGADMLAAVRLARQNKKTLILIDQDIQVTLKKFSKAFPFKEKMRLLWEIIRSPFAKPVKINLREVPEEKVIETMMQQVRKNYPSIYKVLIEDRNKFMARNVYDIMSKNPDKKILVVIGAGHEKEMMSMIKQEDFKRDKVR